MGHVVRNALTATVGAAVVVGLVAALASAAPPTITFVPPSPAEGATLTSNAVSFVFTYDKKPKATQSLTCALSGPTASSDACDAPVAFETGSQSGKSYSDLASGVYTFTVSLTLTDGGTAAATVDFTVNAGHIYWANAGTNTIGRANLDGTDANQSFISSSPHANGVAVDAAYVYWTETGSGIGRANLDGSDANQSFITGASGPGPMAVDAGHVYWPNFYAGTIGRANLDGTGVNQSFISASFPRGVAVDAEHVYWANINGTIGRANLDGTGVNQSFISGVSPAGLAVDAHYIYWANLSTNTIGRANLDGTDVNQSFITGASTPIGVTVDAG